MAMPLMQLDAQQECAMVLVMEEEDTETTIVPHDPTRHAKKREETRQNGAKIGARLIEYAKNCLNAALRRDPNIKRDGGGWVLVQDLPALKEVLSGCCFTPTVAELKLLADDNKRYGEKRYELYEIGGACSGGADDRHWTWIRATRKDQRIAGKP
eukprot:g1989.t1